MATAKRLGSSVFSDSDPFDDLRPTQKKKVFPLAPDEPPQEAEPPAERGLPVTNQLSVLPDSVTSASGGPSSAWQMTVATPPTREKSKPGTPTEPSPVHAASRRVRFSANVAVAIKERAENASYWIPGMTISAITEVALERELRRLEKEHNGGEPFERAGKLKYGRPRGGDES